VTYQSKAKYDFNKLADSYDSWYNSSVGQMYDRLEKKAFDSLLGNYNNGKQLLEIGCGTGHWSRFFSEKGFEVTGIDISEKMINTANKKTYQIVISRYLTAGACLFLIIVLMLQQQLLLSNLVKIPKK